MKTPSLTFKVTRSGAGERADKIMARHFPELSRSHLQAAFDDQHVWLNGKTIAKSHRVAVGDVLTIELPVIAASQVEAVAGGGLTIMHEDEDILVINKGAGVVMHPGSGTGSDTLVHFALHHTGGKLSKLGGTLRPGIVHRLDKDTSGAVVLAKSDRAYLALTALFANREISKEYVALIQGVPDLRSGSLREPIGRNPIVRVKMAVTPGSRGKPAHTDWEVMETFGKRAALVHCWPRTGRTHQIRVHLSHFGYPLLGDYTYGWRPRDHDPSPPLRCMLHAAVLAFPHPAGGKLLEFRAPLPADFSTLLAALREEASRDPKPKIVKRV